MKILKGIKRIHFIGIGGVGVSAIARMARLNRIKVTGSDVVEGKMIEKIEKIGGKVTIGHKKENIGKKIDLVVYSPAIDSNNPELIRARELGILTYSYPEILGLISKDMYTIAVSGTHGKTTVTSMIAEIMIYGNLDPSVVIGGLLQKQQDNFVLGNSKYFLVEACEYKESFLSLNPDILVITNIDNDHLDYYKNIGNIKKAFNKLVDKTKDFIVCNPNDIEIKNRKVIDYSKENIDFKLKVPGEHNIQNAKAAMSVGKLIGLDQEKIEKILKQYSGSWRRFEYKGEMKNGSLIYDDYAHHPTELKATIQAAKQEFDKKVVVVFQPHLYSRTKLFLNEFADALKLADKVIITDIYAAREKKDESIHSKDLQKKVKKSLYFSKFSDIVKYLKKEKDSVIFTIGAGDVYKIGDKLLT